MTRGPPWFHFEHLPVSLPLNLTPESSTRSCSTSSPSQPAQAEGSCCSPCYFCMSNQHLQREPDRLPKPRLHVCSATVLTPALLQELGDSFPSELAPVITLGDEKRSWRGRVHGTWLTLALRAVLVLTMAVPHCVCHQGSVREASRRWSLVSCLEWTLPTALAEREGSPEARTPGQPLPASIRPPATCRATLQSKAIQEEGWSPATHAVTRSATQDHPRAPTQPARTCSGAAPPASTQGHPHFSWVPLPSAVPRGTRSLPLGPSSILSFQPHLTWTSPPSPSPEDNQSKETRSPTVGALETVLGTSGDSDPPHPMHCTSWELPNQTVVLAEEQPKA